MKMPTALLVAFVLSSTALAEDNPASPAAAVTAQTEAAPATTAAPAPQAAGGNKICRMTHGWTCHLHDQSLEPGTNCLCGDHHGVVDVQ
ncbi:hypothetical protein ACFSHT_32100 [Paraburkholderia silviterrae]|uniref:hypothetical protein n=1 Tax=Paraburkholderia silviterrae TaxID=2528715 RepID=UPI00140495F2|nr:hypothetical protein [Paraburkholderia silviterrae]